jgi:hypothetical protein
VAQVTEQQTTVEYVGEDRNQASLDAFWEALTAEQLAGVEAVWGTAVSQSRRRNTRQSGGSRESEG